MHAQSLSFVPLFASLWPVALQASLSMGFSRQEYYWSRLPFATLGDLPDTGTEHASPVFPVLADKFFTTVPPGKPMNCLSFL